MALNDKQKIFIDQYIIDLNATQAAIRAGYSEKTAYSIGQRLLKNVEIQEALKGRMDEKDSSLIMKQDEILERLTKQARREETEFRVVTLKTKTIEAGVVNESERVEIVQIPTNNNDAIKALDLLGKRYAMWTEKQEVDVKGAIQFVDDIGGDEDAT